MNEQFKTCMFGGFAKNDVVNFIAKQAEENRVQVNELQSQIDALQRQNRELEDALRTLHSKAAIFQEGSQNAAELAEQVVTLQEQLQTLQQENDALRGSAQAYAEVKEHIAEIEISAHRRTEEFRAQAIARLRSCINHQKNWCSEQRGRYDGMNEDLLQTLHRCEQIIENRDSEAFDRMLSRLQELEDSLEKE